MILAILLAMCMHPGHTTRIEIRASDDGHALEVAMRIDTADLEAALKRRKKQVVDVDAITEEHAKETIGGYLSETLRFKNVKTSKPPLNWIGIEKHARHVWVFFELQLPKHHSSSVQLLVSTLWEVEPELQHVVVLDDTVGSRTIIVSSPDNTVSIYLPSID